MNYFLLTCLKRLIILTCFLNFTAPKAYNAIRNWDGGGGNGQWNTAANWAGDILPSASDDVILDNTLIAGNYIVNLPAGLASISVNSLGISPGAGNIIILILPATNAADPGLVITGPAEALVLNNGARLQNSSGASTGSGISIINILRINNGARYIHNTNRGHAAIVSQLSSASGTELGEFEYDIPSVSTPVSLSGRTYGTLIFSSVANSGLATYIGTGASPLQINGDLLINAGVTFSISLSADLILNGDLIQTASSSFNIQNSTNNNFVRIKGDISIAGLLTESNSGLPKLELNGLVNQNITVTGSISNSIGLIMNNPSGATLLSPLVLPYHLQLLSGKLFTTAANLLIMGDGATCTGGSVSSFIEGPIKKTGDDDFIFPVGEGGIFAPIGIGNNTNQQVTDQFTAQYSRQNPQLIYGPLCESPLDHISSVEYWTLERNSGTASKFVKLCVNATSFATEYTSLRVSGNDGTLWKNYGQSSFITGPDYPPYITGSLISFPVSNFSLTGIPFTLASTAPAPENPLPCQFLFFTGENREKDILLRWQMAQIPPVNSIFEIEHSFDGSNFKMIGLLTSTNSAFYNFIDNYKQTDTSFYRIKAKNADGRMIYSGVISITNHTGPVLSVHVYPNPSGGMFSLHILNGKEAGLQLIIRDNSSRVVRHLSYFIPAGRTTLRMNLTGLKKGIYFLTGTIKSKNLKPIILIRN